MNIVNLNNIIKYKDKYLKSGVYSFNNEFSQFSNMNCNANYNLFDNHSKNNIFKKIKYTYLKYKFGKKYSVLNEENLFLGNTMLVASTENIIKVIGDSEVLTVFIDENSYQNYINRRIKAGNLYDLPNIKNSEILYSIKENRIFSKNFNDILFVKNLLNKNINADLKTRKNVINSKFLKGESWLETIQHGDLWEGNVLFDGKTFFVIDYEFVDYKYFLYDFFFYIYNKIECYNDYKLSYCYLNGDFDDLLATLFKKYSDKYEPDSKLKYFKIFLLYYWNDRIKSQKIHKKIKKYFYMKRIVKKIGAK